jgi:hypothetical protein
MKDEHVKKVFDSLKPICLLVSSSIQSVRYDILENALQSLAQKIESYSHNEEDRMALSQCFVYITFPLLIICEKDYIDYKESKTNEHISKKVSLKCIEHVFEIFKILFQNMDELPAPSDDQLMKFIALFQTMFLVHLNTPDTEYYSYSTEEIKYNIVSSFNVFVERFIVNKQSNIVSNWNSQPLIAFFLSKLLDLIVEERSAILREECLRTVSQVICAVREIRILKSVFPGVASALFKILYNLPGLTLSQDGINPSKKAANRVRLGHSLLCEAFITFRTMIEKVCADKHNLEALELEKKTTELDTSNISRAFLNIHKKEEEISLPNEVIELNNMRKHLGSFLHHIFSPDNFASLKSPQVRAQMMYTCNVILKECSLTLWSSVPRILESIMIGAHDQSAPEQNYGKIAKQILKDVEHLINFNDSRVLDLLFERFTSLIHSLPNICRTSTGEDQKLATFTLINSYFNIIMSQERFYQLLEVSSFIPKISFALMVALEFENSNETTKIIENNIQELDSSIQVETKVYSYPKKHFRYIRDDSSSRMVLSICENIGFISPLETVESFINHFRQILLNNSTLEHVDITSSTALSSFQKESILIIEHILIGLANRIEQKCDSCIKERHALSGFIDTLLQDYLDEKLWQFPTPNHHKKLSIQIIVDNIVQKCLLLESVGTFFELLKISSVDIDDWNNRVRNSYLIRTLFPILEHLGSNYSNVSLSALQTLDRIAKTEVKEYDHEQVSQLQRITNLIVLNSDYIIDDMRQRMKYLNLYPSTLNVMKALFDYTVLRERYCAVDPIKDTSIISVMHDTLDSIFSALDDYHLSNSYSKDFMRIFFSIMNSVVKVVVQRIQRYNHLYSNINIPQEQAARENSASTDDKELDSKQENIDQDDENDKQLLPDEIKRERELVKQILSKCQNFITLNDMSIKIHIIQIMEQSLLIFLKDGKIENSILPLINKIWPPVLSRIITPTEKYEVQQKALDFVGKLIEYSDEFMYSRILQDLWPRLRVHPLLERNSKNPERHNKSCQEYLQTREQHEERRRHSKAATIEIDPYSYTRTTPQHKLHLAILILLERLTQDTGNVFMKRLSMGNTKSTLHAYDICELLYPFLDSRLPNELQNHALRIIQNISRADYASVWLITNEWFSSKEAITFSRNDNKSLAEIQFPMIKRQTITDVDIQIPDHILQSLLM